MPELLLEILSEEIPARMQARAADDLKRLVTEGLKAAGLEFSSADAYVTPRRLALVIDGLPEKQPDVSEEKRGPNVNAPEQAINGFKGSLPEGAVIEERETPKGVFLFAQVDTKGAATADVLIAVISKAMANLAWPKSMRWAAYTERWVRPVHSLICLFDGNVVPAQLGAISATRATLGHRFLSSGLITVTDFADYKSKLLKAKVILDPAERRAKIEADAKALCAAEGLSLKDDPGLLDEVTGLVEWPVVYMGQIDDDYMDLPDEVLSTSMRSHQKYFSTLGKGGKLANRFIVVANTTTKDKGAQVVAGNERVLRARLSDAKFFWDQDRATKLETRVEALNDRVFHAKLGNLFEKVARVEALAAEIAQYVDGADAKVVKRAARLAKADLSTGMVGEFPELQGIMGRYYALNDGEDAAVADAVAEHYAPQGPNDTCPTAPVSVCVALADKIDTLVGFFAIDEKPTGSKDPYALRRAALGMIRLVLENGLRLPLLDVFKNAHGLLQKGDEPSVDLMAFFADRLKVHLREQGVRHDLIDAVMALGGEDDLFRLMDKVDALAGFLNTDDGANLLTAYKRAANILRIEEKKDGKAYAGESSILAAVEQEEHDLINAISSRGPIILNAIRDEQFQSAMARMAEFRAPVDAYFEKVTVNADDPAVRENRLKTLAHVRRTMDQIADFSKIEGGKA
jgi:glycyl-tRNA synthetase beta chain